MKKILLLSAAACMLSSVHAEDGDSAGGHGFYVGGGLLWSDGGEKVEYQENYDETGAYRPLAKYTESNSMKTNIGGTLLFGYQRVLNEYPVCFGLEIGSDFSPRHEEKNADKLAASGISRTYDLTTTRNGFSPFAAFRIGYISHEYKTMVYFKAGVSYVSSKEDYKEYFTGVLQDQYSGTKKLTTWMPIIALGVEKSVAKDITGRLEGEYRFAKSKTKKQGLGDYTTLTQKGTLNIRALVCYNVKI